jgi:hypothetical protein
MAESFNRTETYRKVRSALVKHWIDLGRISIVVSPGSIRLHGTFARLPGVTTELTTTIMDSIFRELRRVPGIQRVNAKFDNWEQEGAYGGWKPLSKTGESSLNPDRAGSSKSNVYTIRKKGSSGTSPSA